MERSSTRLILSHYLLTIKVINVIPEADPGFFKARGPPGYACTICVLVSDTRLVYGV